MQMVLCHQWSHPCNRFHLSKKFHCVDLTWFIWSYHFLLSSISPKWKFSSISNFSIFNPYGPMSLMWWVLFRWFNFICIIKFTFVLNFPFSMRHAAQGHGNKGKRGKENNKNVHCSSTMGMLKSWAFLVSYL